MLATVFSSGVLILFVLVIRRLYRKKLSGLFLYFLWSIPAARLLVFSLFSVPRRMTLLSPLRIFFDKINVYWIMLKENATELIDINLFWKSRTIVIVWVVGMVIVLIYHITSSVYLLSKLRKSRKLLKKTCDGSLCIYSSEAVKAPFIFGFSIYIPPRFLKDEKISNLVISHETSHFLQFDQLWNFVRMTLSVIYWFHPLVWLAVFKSREDAEYSCDEIMTKNMREDEKRQYARLLLEISTGFSFKDNEPFLKTDMARSVASLRIENLFYERKNHRALETVISVILLTIMLLTLTPN